MRPDFSPELMALPMQHGRKFGSWMSQMWPSLKSEPSFERLRLSLGDEFRPFEELYSNGAQMAVNISHNLLHDVDELPSFRAYVERLETSVKGDQPKWIRQVVVAARKQRDRLNLDDYAIDGMLELAEQQLEFSRELASWTARAKWSKNYGGWRPFLKSRIVISVVAFATGTLAQPLLVAVGEWVTRRLGLSS